MEYELVANLALCHIIKSNLKKFSSVFVAIHMSFCCQFPLLDIMLPADC